MMTLTDQQRGFFETFGYLCLPGLFADEIEEITRHFEALFQDREEDIVDWTHEVHENRPRRFISAATEKDDYLASLVNGDRITGIATALMGEDYNFTGSDASIYDCGTNFHQDGAGMVEADRTHLKMALYLDPIDEHTGAIRVIPGTHHSGKFTQLVNKNIWLKKKNLELNTEDVPSTVIPSQPGDLILWNYKVLHATIYGGNQRRMLALEFGQTDD